MLRLRKVTEEETESIKRLAHSRTEAARTVERARIVLLASQGERVPAIAQQLGIGADTVRLWIKRFNAEGLRGLADLPRSGKPPTYTKEQVGEVIAASLTDPRSLGQPFGSWTLDRLTAYLNEERGIPIRRSRIGEILLSEGLRWRTQETWFGERVDPEFAEKRGSSRAYIRSRPRAVS
ncbi:MAG: helix-turn-helix domain-containing protein [Chloroflexota bacterium]|nr:helix-turn-helix domain-containing protein [Chloroflexota bacterium]